MDDFERRYLALLAQIERYPVTEPSMRAWALAEVERIYRAERGNQPDGNPLGVEFPGFSGHFAA